MNDTVTTTNNNTDNNTDNTTNGIDTLFKIQFPLSIQKDSTQKFNYEVFLTKNYDTYNLRKSIFMYQVDINDPNVFMYGKFLRKEMSWLFYIPRIKKFNQDEHVGKNEIISKFINNMKDDIGTKNVTDVYVILANMYESLPKIDDISLDITFYKLFSEKCISNSFNQIIAPTFCYLAKRLSQSKMKCKNNNNNLFLKEAGVENNGKLEKFFKQFEYLIQNQYHNFLLDRFNFYYNNTNNNNNFKIEYNESMKNSAINLIKRCQIDNNSYFLYYNLGKIFLDNIAKPFKENDVNTITILYAIVNLENQ